MCHCPRLTLKKLYSWTKAVQFTVEGTTDHMVAYERSEKDGKYFCNYILVNLADVANTEKRFLESGLMLKAQASTALY